MPEYAPGLLGVRVRLCWSTWRDGGEEEERGKLAGAREGVARSSLSAILGPRRRSVGMLQDHWQLFTALWCARLLCGLSHSFRLRARRSSESSLEAVHRDTAQDLPSEHSIRLSILSTNNYAQRALWDQPYALVSPASALRAATRQSPALPPTPHRAVPSPLHPPSSAN